MLELSCNLFVRLSSRDATRRPSAPQRCQTFTRQSISEYPPPAQRWNGHILKKHSTTVSMFHRCWEQKPICSAGTKPPRFRSFQRTPHPLKNSLSCHISVFVQFFCRADKMDAFRGSFLASGRWITMWHFSSGCYATPFYSSAAVMTLIVSFQMSCH